MNIAKIQSNLVTAICKKKAIDYKYGYTSDGKKVVLLSSDVLLYLINTDDFVVDLSKWSLPSFTNPDRIIKEADIAIDALRTNDQKLIPEYKATVVKIANDSEHAWVNEINLKMFDADAQFKIINRKSPVFIYEHDELVGVVLPVNVKGDSDGTGKKL